MDDIPEEQVPDEIKIKYSEHSDFEWRPVSGAWGGLTPRGDIIAGFFFEKQRIPSTVTHEITNGGELGSRTDVDFGEEEPAQFERVMLFGAVLTADRARSIASWLEQKADELESLTGDGDDGNDN